MSRFGDEESDALDQGLPLNATCADCGIDYAKGAHDRSVWCDACSDARDRWATAMELKTMVKAVLTTDLAKIKDVS